jgi:hypothetical protein
MHRPLLALLLLTALIAVACGGSDDKKGGLLSGLGQEGKPGSAQSAGSPPVLDACKQFNKDDAAATLKQEVNEGVHRPSRNDEVGSQQCTYTSADGNSGIEFFVYSTSGMSADYRAAGNSARSSFEKGKSASAVVVPGIGDGAYIRATAESAGTSRGFISAIKGEVAFNIQVYSSTLKGTALTDALKLAATRGVAKSP